MKHLIAFIKTYKWLLVLMAGMGLLGLYSPSMGTSAFNLTLVNIQSMLKILPPIFILIGLLDAWVPRETMIRHMGHDSGIKGILIAFVLGSFAAGPLYAAFPVAAILLKKGARLSYVLFFLGVWSTSKLPMVLFEVTSFGLTFTLIHIISNLTVFLIGAVLIESALGEKGSHEVLESINQLS
ncbi:MAG: hypothetical protein PWP51_1599 [Clostridiales bacterium]|jgi:uncharacterized membrane protein YraQ (UPF0718 family)|nr:hypothetical protein [Clostridiales bacterium]MDN5299046.1 hypothetical protein [Clostridiales bacterium]